jgi:hypothetical protein
VLGGVEVGVSETGIAGGVAVGAGVGGTEAFGRATFGRATFGVGKLGLNAAFLATRLALGLALLGAALTALFATFALLVCLAFAFIGRAFFFATLFLTAWRLAFATGRFLDLLFFAMVTLLLEIVRTRRESSPEKVCCHLCVTLESVTRIA